MEGGTVSMTTTPPKGRIRLFIIPAGHEYCELALRDDTDQQTWEDMSWLGSARTVSISHAMHVARDQTVTDYANSWPNFVESRNQFFLDNHFLGIICGKYTRCI